MTIIDPGQTIEWHSDRDQVHLPDGTVCLAARVYLPAKANPYRVDGPLIALSCSDTPVTFLDECGITVFITSEEGRMFVLAHADTKEGAERLLARAEMEYLVEYGFRLRTLDVQHGTAFKIALRSGWSPS